MAGEFEVREQLSIMYRRKTVDGLYLDDHCAFDKEVDAVANIETNAFIRQRERASGFRT